MIKRKVLKGITKTHYIVKKKMNADCSSRTMKVLKQGHLQFLYPAKNSSRMKTVINHHNTINANG